MEPLLSFSRHMWRAELITASLVHVTLLPSLVPEPLLFSSAWLFPLWPLFTPSPCLPPATKANILMCLRVSSYFICSWNPLLWFLCKRVDVFRPHHEAKTLTGNILEAKHVDSSPASASSQPKAFPRPAICDPASSSQCQDKATLPLVIVKRKWDNDSIDSFKL